MTSTAAMAPIALPATADGVIRIAGTQVTLDTAIDTFLTGALHRRRWRRTSRCPGLDDIYAVLTYFLRHRDEVDAYLDERRSRAEAQRREIAARSGHSGPRGRLLVRLGRYR